MKFSLTVLVRLQNGGVNLQIVFRDDSHLGLNSDGFTEGRLEDEGIC